MIFLKEIFIERREEILRIAVKESGKLKECLIEEENDRILPDQIYKGIVKNIVPAIKCAFIDIGYEKKCYMYIDKKFGNINVKKGDEILVQVVKEEVGTKGAKVTNALTIIGRYCVLMTLNNGISFSKKINDENFKNKVLNNIKKPEDIGVMLRTVSSSFDMELINEEISELYKKYLDICKNGRYALRPGLLYDAGGILGKTLRDKLDEKTSKIYVDNKEDYEYINKYITNISDINIETVLYEEERTLFDYYGIEKEILGLRNNKVMLNCGGYIVIDRTEAMHVIDVNSGKNVKDNSIQKTAFGTNLQAAEQIAHQVRLRNLSGIILVDFIDMNNEDLKNKILDKLREGFEGDKSKTVIYPFTELNLVQISRRRVGKSIYEYIEESCSHCGGKGKRLKLSYVSLLIKNEIKKNSNSNIKDLYIEVNEIYKEAISEDIFGFIKNIDALDKTVYMKYVQNEEYFKVESLLFKNQIHNLEMYKVYE